MKSLPKLLEASAALHKHLCPRQVLGVRMGLFAGDLLGLDMPQSGRRLLTIVETDGCAADGVSVATNCWVGRRTMRVEDFGKVAATFVDTVTERAVRIAPGPEARTLAGGWAPEAKSRWEAMLLGYQRLPADKLFVFEAVSLNVPLAELISRPGLKAVCEACGEEILNGREIHHEGTVLCRACAGRAYYHVPAPLEPSESAAVAELDGI